MREHATDDIAKSVGRRLLQMSAYAQKQNFQNSGSLGILCSICFSLYYQHQFCFVRAEFVGNFRISIQKMKFVAGYPRPRPPNYMPGATGVKDRRHPEPGFKLFTKRSCQASIRLNQLFNGHLKLFLSHIFVQNMQ